jgi:eukaryotic-like serine/threonine-protein kinase
MQPLASPARKDIGVTRDDAGSSAGSPAASRADPPGNARGTDGSSNSLGVAPEPAAVGASSSVFNSHDSTHSSILASANRSCSSEDRVPAPLQFRDPTRYQILAEHGRGGLGRVYRARDKELGRDVALKELLQPTYRSELRFFREALITARLEHPGIIPVHEAGRWPDGTPFYSMKLVAGRPFADLLVEAQTLDDRLALLPRLIAVADAIAYAHDRNIIHRDLKPSNVIIGDFGETIVIDWGLAKDLTDTTDDASDGPFRTSATPDVTAVGTVLGTPAYMSPEQARGHQVDTRSDVYSLGAMLYQLCVSTLPHGDSTENDLRKGLTGLHEDLITIAVKALSHLPQSRYPTASAFAADLRAYDAGARISARQYSLAARLSHWLSHHKRLAISIAIPTVVAAVFAVTAIREIVLQRDHASNARLDADTARIAAEKERGIAEHERSRAEDERDRAVRAQAALLLERDPTRARSMLASRESLSEEDALLVARAQGAGAADQIVSVLPLKIWRVTPESDLQQLAIATSDLKLRTINLSSGSVDVLDTNLLEPPFVVREGSGLTYARHGVDGPELIRTGLAHPIPLSSHRMSTDNQAAANKDGTYLLGSNGDLVFLSNANNFIPVGHDIKGIALHANGLVACNGHEILEISGGRTINHGGPCRHNGTRYALAANKDSYAVQEDLSTVTVQRGLKRLRLPVPAPSRFVMAPSGLLVGADKERTWHLVPGANRLESGPPSESPPTALGADGKLAAWGYRDGIARLKDTQTGAVWIFVGHSGPVMWVFVSERSRTMVTVGGSEVRAWRIPSFSFTPLGSIHCGIFNAALSDDHTHVAFDCADGQVSVLNLDGRAPAIRTLHRHSNLAFGVTWRRNEVCSSGRDGRVICTDPVTSETRVIAHGPGPIRFIHSAGDALSYTVEDGGVWLHLINEPAPRLLYRHRSEPFRLAVNNDGDVASGALDGSVMLYDHQKDEIFRSRHSHSSRVHQISWSGSNLLTTSYDGTIRTWDRRLSMTDVASFNQPLGDFVVVKSGWAANVGGTSIWLREGESDFEMETGPVVTELAASPNGRFIAATVGADLLLYDLNEKRVAATRFGDPTAHCLQFVDDQTLLLCGSSGQILSTSVQTLPFVKLDLRTKE